MNFSVVQVNESCVLVMGGIQLSKSGAKQLTDLWQFNSEMVKDDIPVSTLAKKKELTGSIWTQIEYKIVQNGGILEYQLSKARFAQMSPVTLSKISEKEILLVCVEACFIYDISRQHMTEIDLKINVVSDNQLFEPQLRLHLIDISNYNLGIF